jgi:hypothetical protein
MTGMCLSSTALSACGRQGHGHVPKALLGERIPEQLKDEGIKVANCGYIPEAS